MEHTTDNWEKRFDEACPPVVELLPVEYGKYLETQGWTMASFEMENERRRNRALAYHENVKKMVRSLLSEDRERMVRKIKAQKYIFDRPKEDYLPETYRYLTIKNEARDDIIASLTKDTD
jgi:hypothetical protein